MSGSAAHLVAVNVVYEITPGPTRRTAIDKRPVSGRIVVGRLGLAGDTQCDTRYHGGPDRALYAYAVEDAVFWAERLGREIPPGLFGENLSTQALDVSAALIGERWRIGEGGVVVEVRLPRTPCANLSGRMGIPGFHRRFAEAGCPGAYLRVIGTGRLAAGDPISVESRPGHGVTVRDAFHRQPEPMRRLLDSGIDLAPDLRRSARRAAARSGRPAPHRSSPRRSTTARS